MDNGKKRKNYFTDREIRTLIEIYAEHKNSLTAKCNNTMTNKHKLAAWKSITGEINYLGDGGIRTVEECRKKWKDLLSRAKKDASVLKNPPTGGGPAPKTSPYSKIIISIFGEDSPTFTGLNGIDSSEPSTLTFEEVDADVSAVTSDSEDRREEGSPTPTASAMTQGESQMATPRKRKRDLSELQRELTEKEIVHVEVETVKLRVEHEEIEMEKLRLQIIILKNQLLITEEDDVFTVL
ncbi:uncharacterized protein LOC117536058 [Gymnodraco acuticeps]|uniref:Uncharacterized protein LOC117536058 n=1 Tax=Gymnodraco acuticeps TaxID=8218 RepID=A0A6P8SZW7_GYMAC|nr:uncharacterized protein LOC117536058 [Gymnodraco acuticeps]XP_034056683.1 uncharacterized protein LOC117536058 [Gymnodraco acuticeps]